MTSQLFFQDLSVKFWYAVITAKVLAAITESMVKAYSFGFDSRITAPCKIVKDAHSNL